MDGLNLPSADADTLPNTTCTPIIFDWLCNLKKNKNKNKNRADARHLGQCWHHWVLLRRLRLAADSLDRALMSETTETCQYQRHVHCTAPSRNSWGLNFYRTVQHAIHGASFILFRSGLRVRNEPTTWLLAVLNLFRKAPPQPAGLRLVERCLMSYSRASTSAQKK